MAKLSKAQILDILNRRNENRAKSAAGKTFYGYLSPELMEKHQLKLAQFKKNENPYYINMLGYMRGENDPSYNENPEENSSYTFVTKVHSVVTANGRKMVICPKAQFPQKNLRCPMCELREALMESDPLNPQIKDLKPKERNLYYINNVTNTEEAAKGIQVVDISAFFLGWPLNKLCQAKKGAVGVKQSGPVDISSGKKGKTVKFLVGEKVVPNAKGGQDIFPEWTGHELLDRDPLSMDLMEACLDLPPLDELIIVPSYDELMGMMTNSGEEDGGAEDSGSKEPEKKEEKKAEKKEEVKKAEKKVDKEFDYQNASTEELEEFIEDNSVPIDEDDLGDLRKMKIAVKKFIRKRDAEFVFLEVDSILDVDEYIELLEEKSKLKEYCDKFGIKYSDDDDDDELKNLIDKFYYIHCK